MSVSQWWKAALLGGCTTLFTSVDAGAYCPTTTCDPNSDGDDACVEVGGCFTGGLPLFWKPRCITYSVQEDASPKLGISYEAANTLIGNALRKWAAVDCGGGTHPSIEIFPTPPVVCNRVEYNDNAGNANVWIFHDAEWPYDDDGLTLGLTTITFNVETGEIYDADVEINSAQNDISVGGDRASSDFASIATHESGHVLGLSHSTDPRATMFASYQEGTTTLRSLSEDDAAGICATHPPERPTADCPDTPEPRHGFSSECGPPESSCVCTAPGSGNPSGRGALLLAAGLALAWIRRHRQAR